MPADRKSIPSRIFAFFSGFGLATTLLLLLGVETWLATLEQVQYGLYPTLQKYFHHSTFWVRPDAGVFKEDLAGKLLFPLPNGYWVCALLVVNLTLGGLIRARKGWKTVGVLMAHFGMIFMIVAGGVAQRYEERGVMVLQEGEVSDFAQALTETTIEIAEIKDGKVAGAVHFIPDPYFTDLAGEKRRTVKLPALPFDLELQTYIQNARPVSVASMVRERGEPAIDGWFLFSMPAEKETERDTPGIHARVLGRDGKNGDPFLLAVASFHPATVEADGRTFSVRLVKRTWHVPFKVQLDEARAEMHPNTMRPKSFESDIRRLENGTEVKVRIVMNEPMRHAGYTFFQRNLEPGDMQAGSATISAFEVVRNPSDQWPTYSLYLAGLGLVVHFLMKLVLSIKGRKATTAA